MQKLHNFDEVFDSQEVFRIILEAASNPTRTLSISKFADKLFGKNPALLTVAMTLLDNETSFCATDSDELKEQILLLTHSRKDKMISADYIFITDSKNIEKAISDAKCGTLADPHKSAMLIIADNGSKITDMSFGGSGIDGKATVKVSKSVKAAVTVRDIQNYEYPQGIDLVFVSDNGDIFCIPRTTHMEEE